jgi:nicotinamidase-related amidase
MRAAPKAVSGGRSPQMPRITFASASPEYASPPLPSVSKACSNRRMLECRSATVLRFQRYRPVTYANRPSWSKSGECSTPGLWRRSSHHDTRGSRKSNLDSRHMGTEVVEALKPRPEDRVVYKHRYSGFYETELDSMLKQAGINQLIVTGCTTSVCVESTIRDAYYRDYQAVLLTDCIDEPIGQTLSRTNHDASLMLVEMLFGWVAVSEQFLKACGGNRVTAMPSTTAASPP